MPEAFHSSQQVKIFILYLLEKIGYPLEYNDIATIVIRDGYVDFFDFVTHFHELLNEGHIVKVEDDNDKDNDNADATDKGSYKVSDTGKMIAQGLSDDLLLAAVREKSYISAMRHLSLEKRGAVCEHSVEPVGDGTYIFHCSIKDCNGLAFSLDLRADSFTQVQRMSMNFEDKPDVVYRGLIAMVSGNANFLLHD